MSDDLVTWLRAIYDEREVAALAAGGRGPTGQWHTPDGEMWAGRVEDGAGNIVVYDEGSPTEAQAAHIADNDPAGTLAEVYAKRRILDALLNERHQVVDDCWYTCPAATEAVEGETNCDDDAGTECRCGRDYRADRYARLLALPYADRPGYRDEWKP